LFFIFAAAEDHPTSSKKGDHWMIKVVFTYQTKKEDLPELMDKFAQSRNDLAFQSEANKGF